MVFKTFFKTQEVKGSVTNHFIDPFHCGQAVESKFY